MQIQSSDMKHEKISQSNRSNSSCHNDMEKLIVLFVAAANEIAAQHSNTWLVLAVAATVHFRNPPPV